jgi:hypothetical protein
MILLIEFLIAQEIYKQEKSMISRIKKLLNWLDKQSQLSAPSYTCESALLMSF